ncbi:MAG: PTS glucose transporter subunit IIA [Atopobiaceae bacterium]|nr:PTS glucose transporter subunit IIA [Atopobiaceae bacterium]
MGGGLTLPAESQRILKSGVDLEVCAPVRGVLAPMEDIPDPVFSSGIMGTAAGIWPASGCVCAPATGEITIMSPVMPHAITIKTSAGPIIMVHVGVGTVDMHGAGFRLLRARGDNVQAGDPLLEFDIGRVHAANKCEIVIVIVTNSERYGRLVLAEPGLVEPNDPVITVYV